MTWRGSSGATVTIVPGLVTKSVKASPTRLLAQVRWLTRHPSPAVPRVTNVGDTWYGMEELFTIQPRLLDHEVVGAEMIEKLRKYVWSQPAEVTLDIDALSAKIDGLLKRYVISEHVHRFLRNSITTLDWDDLKTCLTHGDPTFENVMFRSHLYDSGLVLIDPIPATPAIPDLQVVDTGKILQSLLGWEQVRYGHDELTLKISTEWLTAQLTQHEWKATVFFAVVHLLRTLPYVDSHVRDNVKEMMFDATHLVF